MPQFDAKVSKGFEMISVIICTYNRSAHLQKFLDSLRMQDAFFEIDFEIILVDNNSKDQTKTVVEANISSFHNKLRYVFEPQQGVCWARNRGIDEAKGEIIAFTDDDVILNRDWLVNIRDFFRQFPEAEAVGGRILPSYPQNVPQWVKKYRDILNGPIVSYDYGRQACLYSDSMYPFVGANMMIKKDVVLEIGKFRVDIGCGRGSMGDDTEIFERLKSAGKKIYYCGLIELSHPVDVNRMSLKYIARWSIQSGRYLGIKEIGAAQNLTCYFGIPRYLIRRFAEFCLRLTMNIFNQEKFLVFWMKLFRCWGMMLVYRKYYKAT